MSLTLRVNEIQRIPNVVRAIWFNQQLAAVCYNSRISPRTMQLVIGSNAYTIPAPCIILAASEQSVYAIGLKPQGKYTFVYPQNRWYSVAGGLGVYEREKTVWFRSPDNKDIPLFPAPLLRLERSSDGSILAASNYEIAVIREQAQIEVLRFSFPLAAAGLDNGNLFYALDTTKESLLVCWNDHQVPFSRMCFVRVLGDTIIGGDGRGLWILPQPDGEVQKISWPITHLSAGRGRSVLACVGGTVLEIEVPPFSPEGKA